MKKINDYARKKPKNARRYGKGNPAALKKAVMANKKMKPETRRKTLATLKRKYGV